MDEREATIYVYEAQSKECTSRPRPGASRGLPPEYEGRKGGGLLQVTGAGGVKGRCTGGQAMAELAGLFCMGLTGDGPMGYIRGLAAQADADTDEGLLVVAVI